MAVFLPYRLTTAGGDRLDVDFALHGETQSAVDVARLLSAVLDTVDRELHLGGDVGNGDVLQALAMALAARARLVPVAPASTARLARELLETALTSVRSSPPTDTPVGHA